MFVLYIDLGGVFLDLLYVDECFVLCMYVHQECAWISKRLEEGFRPRNWSYVLLWVTLWLLGIESRTSVRAKVILTMVLNLDISSLGPQFHKFILKDTQFLFNH